MSDSEDDEGHGPVTTSSIRLSEDEIISRLLTTSTVSLKTLIPSSSIKSENALKVAVWILTSHAKKRPPNHILQRIKWLTAIVQYGIIDSLNGIEKLFNPFIQLIFITQYQASICHLLYMIATPSFQKFQVERIMRNANITGLMKPLVGLLGRLKSLRPDLVPQAVPYQSNAVSFPKAPPTIRSGLYDLAEHMRQQNELPNQFTFTIESEEQKANKKMRMDIIPRVQHINLKSSFEIDLQRMVIPEQFKTFNDLVGKITVVQLPNHVGSLLSKREYHYILYANWTPRLEALLSQWLYLTLYHEFIERRQGDCRDAKTLLLQRVIEFQESTGRKLMVVYDFLSEYLRIWDGIQYREHIFQLLSALPVLPYSDLYENFLRLFENMFQYSPTPFKLQMINSCRKLIHNLLVAKFGPPDRLQVLCHSSNTTSTAVEKTELVEGIYIISEVIRFIVRLYNTALTSTTDIRVLLSSLDFHLWLVDVESQFHLPFRTLCQPITVYAALFSPVPAAVSLLCILFCKFKENGLTHLMTISTIPELKDFHKASLDDASMLSRYIIDISNCLIYQKALVSDSASLLSRLPRRNIRKLLELGDYKGAFDIKRHPAFMGIARQWIKSNPNYSAEGALDVFKEIEADGEGFFRFLFSHFPAIRNYMQEFHSD
ncbi:uncharacterized protein LOC130702084 [Daphnia carinata]|uniref:uncharacterized protein LOC130702084 n=1 Tax=Daphnia carinata TaxID=120202 RepID=UPI002581066E|nr:uncharacterized protein LOC130702084 [Daphnia carinata]